MNNFVTVINQQEQSDRRRRILYPFHSIHTEPWTDLRDPAFKSTKNSTKPPLLIPMVVQKPIFGSQLIRYSTIDQLKKDRQGRPRKKHSQKLPTLNLSLVRAVKSGDKIYIDLNTKKEFSEWRGKQPPASPASKLNMQIIREQEEAKRFVQRQRRRVSEIRSSMLASREVRAESVYSPVKKIQTYRVKTEPDQRVKTEQVNLLKKSNLKDPVLRQMITKKFSQLRKQMLFF